MGPAAVEPSTCPSKGQDPAESETLEAETAPASNAATRNARPATTCSTLEILCVMVATDHQSDKILFSNLVNPCTSMGIVASVPRCASNCESFLAKMASDLSFSELVGGAPTLSRSGTEPSGEPKFEERLSWKHICVLCIIKPARVSHERRREPTKLGCRHSDKTKPENLVTQKNHTHQNGYGCRTSVFVGLL